MKTIETSTADAAADGLAPRRLLDGGGDAFERMLVEPSLSERPPQIALERLARALELPPDALPTATPEPRPDAPPRDGSWLVRNAARLRLGAVGAVAVGLGLTGWGLASRERESSEPAPIVLGVPSLAAAPEGRDAPPIALPALDSSAAQPREHEGAAPTHAIDVAAAPRALKERLARPRAPRPTVSRQLGAGAELQGLSAELRALENVQRALSNGQASAAARALAHYERHFERGELALEAELLGVEVALASGDVNRARTRAREIAARPAAARYRQRLEALMRAADVSDPARNVGAKTNATHIESAEVNR